MAGAGASLSDKLALIHNMPAVRASDEELGLGDLLRIFPDTWNNISWAVQNSVDLLVKQAIAERRQLEEVKEYSIRANKDHLMSIDKAVDKAAIETGRVKQELSQLDGEIQKKMHDSDRKFTNLITAADAKTERVSAEVDGRLTLINQKIDQVQTWEYIDLIMKERIQEVNDDLLRKFKK